MNKCLQGIKSAAGCVFRGVQDAFGSWNSRVRTRYAHYYKHCRIRKNVVLYESFFGKGLLCNPYAIFLELLNNPKYSKFKHVWVLVDDKSDDVLLKTYADHPNVIFVKRNSRQYLKYLCSAKYLVNNVTFPDYFTKKEGQIYVNTWHGVPLKTLGFDIPNGAVETANVVRNFLHADYMISACPFLTEIYYNSYKLKKIYQGKIIEEGYPRLDILTRFSREQVLRKMESYGVRVDTDKKVILFAPTWRGKTYAEASSDVGFYFEFKKKLEAAIDTSKYQILIKVHQRVYELAKDKLTDSFFIPSAIDANEVLSITDVLVSDFSSIYIDFLATGRPILFYIPDLASYSVDRGLYRSPETLPGPCANNLDNIAEWVNHISDIAQQYRGKYDAERQWSNGYNAGNISKKIVDIVFEGHEADYKIHQPKCDKKRILISRGRMLVNGISTSFLSLLDNIDYEKFDVSVMVTSSKISEERNLINRINPNARVIVRNSPGCFTLREQIIQHYYERNTYQLFHPMYKRDVQRCYGNAQFDYVLDFEGYNTYYSILCLQFKEAYKCIWQHNDMLAEKEGKYPWLEVIFDFYKYFDKVVSCAKEVMLVNRKNLVGKYCDAEKFGYMKNFIDVRRIQQLSSRNAISMFDNKPYIVQSRCLSTGRLTVEMLPFVPKTDAKGVRNYRFVTVGRCSVEKNHENLIRAFTILYRECPNVYLYILGDGKLKSDTDGQIAGLGLGNHIFAPGNVENPFSVLENADCFILPSLHEGQPMVINEARMLRMPIIVSNFSSVSGILVENGQLLIGTTVEDIYAGMKSFIAGEVPTNYSFDAEAYNQEAYREFLNALGE